MSGLAETRHVRRSFQTDVLEKITYATAHMSGLKRTCSYASHVWSRRDQTCEAFLKKLLMPPAPMLLEHISLSTYAVKL